LTSLQFLATTAIISRKLVIDIVENQTELLILTVEMRNGET